MVASTTSTTATTTTSQISTGISRLADNEQTFLALLTTQLKNQDPLSPMDSNAFTAQITQMTGVEQQLVTNKLLQSLVDKGSSDISSAVGLIGKTATASGDTATLKNGKAAFTYNLAGAAKDVSIKITNSDGTVVYRGTGSDNAAGDHTFTWDGKSEQGQAMADGTYKIAVSAVDSTGTAVTVSNFMQGVVTGVEMKDGAAVLTINGAQVPLSSVTAVAATS